MRLLALIAIGAAACGGGRHAGPHEPAPPPEAAEFPALRFVPDHPTYIVTTRTVGDAQRAIVDLLEPLGTLGGFTSGDIGRALAEVIAVDPLGADLGTKLGVDLAGGLVVFSESTDPTFVAHLAAPETAQGFFDHLREQGLRTTSVIVEGNEINTARLASRAHVSWTIDKDWLWVHFTFGDIKDKDADATAWFSHGRHPTGTAWTHDLAWAKQLGAQLASKAPGLVGFFDSHAVLGALLAHAPQDALACAARFEPIGKVALAVEGDGKHAGGRLAFELGPAAKSVAAALLPPPPGFAELARTAPIAAQWNLDVPALVAWLEPCARSLRLDKYDELAKLGVRTGRVALETLDPGDKSGTGVVALDLSSKQYFAGLLDQIPRRSMFESDRRFGTLAGHHLKIPFVATLDYVLDDHVAAAAMGDGLLDKLVAGPPPTDPVLFALEVQPLAMSADAWAWLIALATNERYAKAATERLVRWHDGHVVVSIEGDALVIEAAGNRR